MTQALPLEGVRVLELGQLIAGPFSTKLFGEFGADIIKIEPPGRGDPLRKWRKIKDGTSLWWHVQSRNKKSVTLNLKDPEIQGIVHELVTRCDVVVENFRPGTLEKWNLGWETLSELNPRLIMVRISGYGQTGPYRDQPGFAAIGEAVGGIRYLTGHPGQASVRVGLSLGDSLAALYGATGALIALRERDRSGQGQYIDVALYESVFALTESLIPEYDVFGYIREPSGGALPGITPSNVYPCSGGEYVLIAANGDSIYQRLMETIGREDLAGDSRLQHNDGRSEHAEMLDEAITEWTRAHTRKEILAALERADVPAGYPYNAADIVQDPHYRAREMIQSVDISSDTSAKVPGVVPKLGRTPGRVGGAGPELGAHTDEVLEELGINEETRRRLRDAGNI